MSVSIGNWELNRGPNSILVSTQNENGVAGKNVKLTKKDHLVTRLLLRFPGFFSFFSGPFKIIVYKSCVELFILGKEQHAHLHQNRVVIYIFLYTLLGGMPVKFIGNYFVTFAQSIKH